MLQTLTRLNLTLFTLALLPVGAWGQAKKFADVADLTAEFVPPQARPGDTVTLKLTITPRPDCWTYPFNTPPTQTSKNTYKPAAGDWLVFQDPVVDPDGWIEKESDNPPLLDRVYKKSTTWDFKFRIAAEAAVHNGPLEVKGFVLQACNKSKCFNFRDVTAHLEVLPAAGTPPMPPPTVAPPMPSPTPPPGESSAATVKKPPQTLAEYEAKLQALEQELGEQKVSRSGGTWTLLLTAAFWGLVSLATPCVFPMIPITVSLFLKQSNQSASGAMKQAGIYCLTIILVLGISAIFLLSVFRALSVNPLMNLALGALFLFFALSLFGMYEIVLPNFMLRYAEGKRKSGGLIGTVFGAIAFSIVSFTCVAPFLGGFAGMAASGQFSPLELALAGLTFASAFAAPFFVLAIFPSLLKQLPRSGGWLDSVKVVMGFLELAAALKFLRTAELRFADKTAYFTYDIVLAGWVVIAFACGAYLLNLFRLPHDEEKSNIGVPRLIFALLFLGLGVYLLPGLFKHGNSHEGQRPAGVVYDWIDAFLLPEPTLHPGGGGSEELPWSADLPAAFAAAKRDAKQRGAPQYIFVDFTGVTCTNCKANERAVFPRPEAREQFKQMRLVQMYTDDVPAAFYQTPPDLSERSREGALNLAFQKKLFGTEQLPLYVIFEVRADSNAKVFSTYDEGKINEPARFFEFLASPFKKK